MKNLLLCLITLFVILSCKKDYVTILGEIEGKDGEMFFLVNLDNSQIDTILLENGRISYQIKIPEEPTNYQIFSFNYGAASFYIENKDIKLLSKKMEDPNSSYYSLEVEGGGDVQKESVSFSKRIDEFYKDDGGGNLTSNMKLAYSQNDTVKYQKLLKKYKSAKNKTNEYFKKYILDNPKSYFATDLLLRIVEDIGGRNNFKIRLNEVKSYIDNVDKSLISSKPFKKIKVLYEELKNSPIVGSIIPDYVQNDVANQPIRLSDEYKKGKYLLIDFWASWCAPCRRGHPHLLDIYKKYHNRGLNLLSVSLDTDKNKWKKAVEQDKLIWTQVSELKEYDSEFVKLCRVSAVPHNILVDNKGEIIEINVFGEKLDKLLASLFEE